MEEQLVALVGSSEGAKRPYAEWVSAAREQGLRPEQIQRLKQRKLVYTELDANMVVWIVRGQRPQGGE